MKTTDRERNSMRYYGGEIDGPSRQLARYIDKISTEVISLNIPHTYLTYPKGTLYSSNVL